MLGLLLQFGTLTADYLFVCWHGNSLLCVIFGGSGGAPDFVVGQRYPFRSDMPNNCNSYYGLMQGRSLQ